MHNCGGSHVYSEDHVHKVLFFGDMDEPMNALLYSPCKQLCAAIPPASKQQMFSFMLSQKWDGVKNKKNYSLTCVIS